MDSTLGSNLSRKCFARDTSNRSGRSKASSGSLAYRDLCYTNRNTVLARGVPNCAYAQSRMLLFNTHLRKFYEKNDFVNDFVNL